LRTLSASLWDLRSLCEQQLRAITDAQASCETCPSVDAAA
jgi:hypothetical protein